MNSFRLLLLVLIAGCAGPSEPGPSAAPAGEAEQAPGWLASVQEGLAAREYRASESGGGLQAPNRAHGLRTYFEPTGVRVVDRTAPGSPELLSLSLARWGREGALREATPGEVRHAEARVEIARAGLVEWYLNSPAGLEQGFTLAERPPGAGALWLELAVGSARVSLAEGGLVFHSDGGRRLRYGALRVVDANGAEHAARFEPAEAGYRIAVADAGATYPLTIDPLLTAADDGLLQPDQASASLGESVASAGDVNGDGYADVIVGAPDYDAGESDEGAAFVFLGGASGIGDGNPATAHAQLESDQSSSQFGAKVASAGDVNGDGYTDVIVGAWRFDATVSGGAAFLFHGGPSGIGDGDASTADAVLESDALAAAFGFSVASAGDVNGDGYDDVIVGARSYGAGFPPPGAAFVFLGSASGVGNADPTTAHARFETAQTGARLGESVASAGDVNGDGYADVIVGAPLYDAGQTDEGAAFVFLGSAVGLVDGSPATAHAQLESGQISAQLGAAVATAGDVNGDGYADVIIGVPFYDNGHTDEGGAFIFFGSASGLVDGDPTTADVHLESNQAGAGFGSAVASAGDVNGNGYADYIIGAPDYDDGESGEGAAFVYLGGPSGLAAAFGTLESNQSNASFGGSAASAGDVNGDGYDDVIVGARLYDAGQTNEGAAFVYHGGASGIASGDPGTAHAQIESDQGSASLDLGDVASAGDVNGDGYADVIVGGGTYDAGEADEGAVFLFLGSASGIAGGDPGTADAQLESDQAGANFGSSLASAGDVNGDGYDDVIVGAPGYDSGESDEGAAFVFLGGASGLASAGPATAHARLESDQATAGYGSFGISMGVASAGDVDGDGYADVIVGWPGYDAGESDEGAAFVFLGSAAGLADGDPGTADAQLESDQSSAELGSSVASAGDVNGDGYADVIVGAWQYDAGQSDEGTAFVFHGGASGIADGDPGTADAQLEADQMGARMALSVASAGDVNGDGYADVIVGARNYSAGESGEGAAFVFLGSAAGVTDAGPGGAHAGFESDQAFAALGQSVASAGDVNGDGYADVIIGAGGYDAGEMDEGAAFVFLGSASGLTGGTPATADAQLESDQASALLGASVASAGDVNGDGFADVIVGATVYDAGETDEGAAFVFLGNSEGRPVRAEQRRGDGSGTAVAAWGRSEHPSAFQVSVEATSPRGRERAKLEIEACPAGTPFGDVSCTSQTSPSWIDLGLTGAIFTETVSGLTSDTLYHWRARVLYAPLSVTEPGITEPLSPRHGPWRRHTAQAVEADVRVLPEPEIVAALAAGALLLATLAFRRGWAV